MYIVHRDINLHDILSESLPSNCSIIVTHENKVYKYIVDTAEREGFEGASLQTWRFPKSMSVSNWHEDFWLERFPGLPHAYFSNDKGGGNSMSSQVCGKCC